MKKSVFLHVSLPLNINIFSLSLLLLFYVQTHIFNSQKFQKVWIIMIIFLNI